MIGMTSVTFRSKTWEEVLQIAAENGLDGIEWGGDIHLPAGDVKRARMIASATAQAGLVVVSYGSYYRLLESGEPIRKFDPILKTAQELGAPTIRIWAGSAGSGLVSQEDRSRAADELRMICTYAAKAGIGIALEKHRHTLTDTAESALALLQSAACPNLSCYWQPNPEWDIETNERDLYRLLPYISNIHVFHWAQDDIRLPMSDGIVQWKRYLQCIKQRQNTFSRYYLMEFTQNESVLQFGRDCAVLQDLLAAT